MNWVVVLVLCAQTTAWSFLVLVEGWSLLEASWTVIGFAVAIPVTVIAGLLLFAPKQRRAEMMQIVRDTIRRDLRDAVRWIRTR